MSHSDQTEPKEPRRSPACSTSESEIFPRSVVMAYTTVAISGKQAITTKKDTGNVNRCGKKWNADTSGPGIRSLRKSAGLEGLTDLCWLCGYSIYICMGDSIYLSFKKRQAIQFPSTC